MSTIGTEEQNKCAVYCNSRINGGGEQSAKMIATMLSCPLYSLTTNEWKERPAPKKQIWYMNDFAQKINDCDKRNHFQHIVQAGEKVYFVLNFVNGQIHKTSWLAEKVRRVFFLNQQKLDEFQSACIDEWKDVSKRAYPPPVNIQQYLDIERPFGRKPIVIGRHSRMSLKYPIDDPGYLYRELAKQIPEANYAFQIPHKRITKEFKDDMRFRLQTWDQQSVREFLASIDIYAAIISPKVRDQGPRVLMEAMASGLPCVVENRDGMKERMINGVTGYLVDSQDEAIKRIIELYNDKNLRMAMGKKARLRAKEFDPTRWIKDMED